MNKNQVALKLVGVMFLVLAVFFLADLFWLKNSHPYISGYLCNVITECIGIIITVYFVQNIFDKYSMREQKHEELNKINRQNKFISEIITQYVILFNCVVKPLNERDVINEFPSDFRLNDMRDLHETTLLINTPHLKSSIEVFYQYEKQLRQLFIKMLDSIDFNYYPNLQKIIMDFCSVSIKNDVSETIINNQKLGLADGKRYTDLMKDMLSSDDIEQLYADYKNDKLFSNGIMPYFALYDLLQEEKAIVEEYLKEIDMINN